MGARGAAGGAAPGATAARGPRGAQVFFVRQRTSKDLLQLKWDYPAMLKVDLAASEGDDQSTATSRRMRALARQEAIANVAGDDLRPLLVLRDCETCKGTDDAILNDRVSNEMTALFSRWFHCVRLPSAVLEADHTFRNLFEGDVAPHMFVCSVDGTNLVALGGRPGQTELWTAMNSVLRQEYEKDPEDAAKQILRHLAKFDHLDSMQEEYGNQLALEIEKRGPNSSKVRSLRAKIERLQREREDTQKLVAKASDLGLKRKPTSLRDGEDK